MDRTKDLIDLQGQLAMTKASRTNNLSLDHQENLIATTDELTDTIDVYDRSVMGEIKSRFDSIAIWIATNIWFKHCAIRFKYHAIWYWFDSNFNGSIQETRDFNRNLEVVVEIEYSFSVLTAQSDLSLNSMQI